MVLKVESGKTRVKNGTELHETFKQTVLQYTFTLTRYAVFAYSSYSLDKADEYVYSYGCLITRWK